MASVDWPRSNATEYCTLPAVLASRSAPALHQIAGTPSAASQTLTTGPSMHTIDLLEQTLTMAERAGIQVRREWLGDMPGGLCRIGATRVLYTNLSLSAEEQLQQLVFPCAMNRRSNRACLTASPLFPQLWRQLLSFILLLSTSLSLVQPCSQLPAAWPRPNTQAARRGINVL